MAKAQIHLLPAARTTVMVVDDQSTSRAILEDLLGEQCVAGSVPGGDISPKVLETAAEAGLRFLFTSEPLTSARRVKTASKSPCLVSK